MVILVGIRKFQEKNLFLKLQTQDFEIALRVIEEKTKRDRKKRKDAELDNE
ncbi:hypothetical protein [Helicobacter phage FrG12G]|nr:hypothetical protein [Helicobacter phage FrG12G]